MDRSEHAADDVSKIRGSTRAYRMPRNVFLVPGSLEKYISIFFIFNKGTELLVM